MPILLPLPAALRRRALRRVTTHFRRHPVAVAYRLACREAESWRERYPAVADWLRKRAEKLRERILENLS